MQPSLVAECNRARDKPKAPCRRMAVRTAVRHAGPRDPVEGGGTWLR